MLDKSKAIVGKTFPAAGKYTCLSVTFVEKVGETDLCLIALSDDIEAVMFAESSTDLLKFIDNLVAVDFRSESIDGVVRIVINSLAVVTKINTFDRDTDFRLVVSQEAELREATASFRDIKRTQTVSGCSLYCIEVQKGASPRSTWVDLLCYDNKFRVGKVRVFNPDVEAYDFAGSYVVCNLTLTQYGYQTDAVYRVKVGEQPRNPMVDLAFEYVNNYMEDLSVGFNEALKKIKFFDTLKEKNCGCELIELAIALSLCREIANVSRHVNMDILNQGIIGHYFHWIVSSNTETSSVERRRLLPAIKAGWTDKHFLHMIDGDTEKEYYEKTLMKHILATAKFINDCERKADYSQTTIMQE